MSIKEFSEKHGVVLFYTNVIFVVLLVITIITSIVASHGYGRNFEPHGGRDFGNRGMMAPQGGRNMNFQAQGGQNQPTPNSQTQVGTPNQQTQPTQGQAPASKTNQ